jgi:3-oxoacyl-[acyl-carrier protein] reductase
MTVASSLSGRHALVCGASAGIGRASAFALAKRGASLTLLARRADRLQALIPDLIAAGAASATALVADLDDRLALAESLETLVKHSPVHILLHNTGGPPGGPLLEADLSTFEMAFGRHVLAGQILVQKLVPGMKAAGYGRIINVISTSVREPIPNLGVSNTIRGAVASWAKSLSRELPPGITINNILPGFTNTERLGNLRSGVAKRTGQTEDQVLKGWIAQVPEGRLAQPEELGAVVGFLASPEAGYIRGVSLPVDGGRLRSI